jgi:hypothetical protein
MRFACALGILLTSTVADANDHATRIGRFIRLVCRQTESPIAPSDANVARLGRPIRKATVTERVPRPLTRYYFDAALLPGWEAFIESGTVSLEVPADAGVTLRDVERAVGRRSAEREEDIHGRMRNPFSAVPPPQPESPVPPPQRVYEYEGMGPHASRCTVWLFLEGQSQSQDVHHYRLTRVEILR